MKKHIALFIAVCLLGVFLPQNAAAATLLEVGSSGSNVKKVQERLIKFGYLEGEADGKYGEATRNAVRWFQKNNNLTVDGRVGPATAAALA